MDCRGASYAVLCLYHCVTKWTYVAVYWLIGIPIIISWGLPVNASFFEAMYSGYILSFVFFFCSIKKEQSCTDLYALEVNISSSANCWFGVVKKMSLDRLGILCRSLIYRVWQMPTAHLSKDVIIICELTNHNYYVFNKVKKKV